MSKFKYEDWLMQFLNDDWYIQINTTENNIIFDEVYDLKVIWSQNPNYYTFIENNRSAFEVDNLPGFLESEEICKTKEYIKSFISGVFHLRMSGLYQVTCDFVKVYNEISKNSYNAIDENGIDVSINKAFLELTEKYYEELITLVRNTEVPAEFKYCWDDLIELIKRFSKYTEKDDKLDIAYQLLEYLSNTIDGFDDLVIDLLDDMIESANKFIAVLIKYEIIFDRLILLKEHLEYQYVETKGLPENFYRVNIIDRYKELEAFKIINEE
ncbi:hypothetical protein [Mesoplasma melaleucae]|uniref:Uncharacterized protein n=1 Tax=Mesoplasma melaleucae TaxID=81459 RepID=A0A2K8NWM9_9MOLU|nr:hypothetical protein [Mesoplasma melaleucae]ATZ18177.1 hypothetical protein EMELA_v1c06700 [Mesoplasma melaleucae]